MRPPVLQKLCADCERPARRRGTRCERCHKRAWRAANRPLAQARERERIFSPQSRPLRNARATVAMAVKRGKLSRQLCRDCGRTAFPHHADLARPLDVVWLCRPHRTLECERAAAAEHAAATAQRQAAWSAQRCEFATAWPTLTSAQQGAVWTIARAHPLIATLPTEAPLARQALVRAYEQWREQR